MEGLLALGWRHMPVSCSLTATFYAAYLRANSLNHHRDHHNRLRDPQPSNYHRPGSFFRPTRSLRGTLTCERSLNRVLSDEILKVQPPLNHTSFAGAPTEAWPIYVRYKLCSSLVLPPWIGGSAAQRQCRWRLRAFLTLCICISSLGLQEGEPRQGIECRSLPQRHTPQLRLEGACNVFIESLLQKHDGSSGRKIVPSCPLHEIPHASTGAISLEESPSPRAAFRSGPLAPAAGLA